MFDSAPPAPDTTRMPTIAISVPSGAHHRSFLLPMRDLFAAEQDLRFLVISPGAPWANELFPATDYPRDRYSFVDGMQAESALAQQKPSLVITNTAGLDPLDTPVLEAAQRLGVRSLTIIESWDNVWKMERVAKGLSKGGRKIILADHITVWNDVMAAHLLRVFPSLRGEQVLVTGAPRLDFFGPRFADKLPNRERTLRYYGLRPEEPVLHFATTELYDHGYVAETIGKAKRRGELPPNLQLYASVHPGGNRERHRPWADQYGFVLRFSPGRREHAPHPDFQYNPTLEDLLYLVGIFKYADVMVNLSSTVALESCVVDRPVICAFFGKPFGWLAMSPVEWWTWRRSMIVRDFHEHYADLLRGGGIAVAKNSRQLIARITACLAHPEKDSEKRRRSAEIIATTLAGDASDRVLATIRRILE